MDNDKILQIDVRQVLTDKNPALAKVIPGFVIKYLKRIVHQDEINDFLKHYGHLRDTEFIKAGLRHYPAGLCSRKKKGVIRDLPWHKSFITKAVQHKRDIVPAYFSGRNSNFFYNLSNLRNFLGIRANIEMLYLADELFRQKGKKIDLVFGKKIPWQTFDNSRTPSEWAEWVKERSYELKSLTA